MVQNVSYGFGAICGASFGGSIVDTISWRWCFLIQVPVLLAALVLGYFVHKFPVKNEGVPNHQSRGIWHQVDFLGSLLLVLALSSHLVGLSLGGNELPRSNIWEILSLVASLELMVAFFAVEATTKAAPLNPLKMLLGCIQYQPKLPISVLAWLRMP